MACLVIADRGIGIPESEAAKVFERFYRAENAGGIPGTGLGLPIARDIVTAHKGTIELTAGPGTGTTAVVKLPV